MTLHQTRHERSASRKILTSRAGACAVAVIPVLDLLSSDLFILGRAGQVLAQRLPRAASTTHVALPEREDVALSFPYPSISQKMFVRGMGSEPAVADTRGEKSICSILVTNA